MTDALSPYDAPVLFLGPDKFIQKYAVVVEPLRALLRKDGKYKWTDDAENATTQVKRLIANSLTLALYNPALPTFVTNDACDYDSSMVTALVDCERKYSTIEKEALACVWVTER